MTYKKKLTSPAAHVNEIQLGFYTFSHYAEYIESMARPCRNQSLNCHVAGTVPQRFGSTGVLLFLVACYLLITLRNPICKTLFALLLSKKSIRPWGEDLFTHMIRKLALCGHPIISKCARGKGLHAPTSTKGNM